MAVSGTVPARRPPRFEPATAARWVRRATLLLAVAVGGYAWAVLGTEWVPAGMRTVPSIPPGSLCLVDRRASAVRVGRDVFVEVDGVRLLSRVAAVDGDLVTVRNPDAEAPWPDSRTFGAVPVPQVRGAVLVVFAPSTAAGGRDG
ncbi:MAG: hypothetical protein KF830_10050 [Planctomycetes bacterium]|nr:hypothetical protein [Planctomycetota bacterium]